MKFQPMAWLWVMALVCGECGLQLTVFACCHFSLQSQGQCEVFPQQCWPTQLPGAVPWVPAWRDVWTVAWPLLKHNTCKTLTFLILEWWVTHSARSCSTEGFCSAAKSWRGYKGDRAGSWSDPHSLPWSQMAPDHQSKKFEGDPWNSSWNSWGLLTICPHSFADRSGASAWGELDESVVAKTVCSCLPLMYNCSADSCYLLMSLACKLLIRCCNCFCQKDLSIAQSGKLVGGLFKDVMKIAEV